MITIVLNKLEFRYDVYQILNLFYKKEEISFVESNGELLIEIGDTSVHIHFQGETKEFPFKKEFGIKEEIKKSIFAYFTERSGKELPWGTLIGIRPTKIALSLMEKGKSEEEIIKYFYNHYFTRRDKAKLCIDIAQIEEKMINVSKNTISIYIGMPFCPTRCLYCSFASNPIEGCRKLVEPYLEALRYEMSETSKFIKEKGLVVETVYFGGGTPTAVNDIQFEEIMKAINNNFIKEGNVKEFTVECGRPDSITLSKLQSIKKYGGDRISINPQTMNEETLHLIGRKHSVQEVIDTFYMAREIGFDNINMDVIVGLPGENSSHMLKTFEEILKLNPENLTVHGMSIKRASRLYECIINKEEFAEPKQDELNKMYELTMKLATSLQMKPYYMYRQKNMIGNMENVGYAKEGKEGVYNIQMIEEKQSIIANGADAVSKVIFLEENRIERFGNVKDVREYINRIEEMVQKKISLLKTVFK